MTTETIPETAAEFLTERRDFLHYHVVRSVGGKGWDVVLRVDGTYADRADAEGVAAYFRNERGLLRDVPADRRNWWDGPPWGTSA